MAALSERHTLVVSLAIIVAGGIFFLWFFLLPHRVPASTTHDLGGYNEFAADAEYAIEQTRQAQETIRSQEAALQQEAAVRQQEQEAAARQIQESREALEQKGFMTTAPQE